MKTKGVFLVPTFMALDWVATNADGYPPNIAEKARVAAASHGDMFRAALRLGVPVALGNDATVRPDGHGRNRSEERRVGNGWDRTGRSRWSPYMNKKKKKTNKQQR